MTDSFTILVINCGSSSIKFKVFELPSTTALIEGSVTGIADQHGEHHIQAPSIEYKQLEQRSYADHQAAFQAVTTDLSGLLNKLGLTLNAVGHRVVHGGEAFIAPTPIDHSVLAQLEQITHLAPQHLPSNVLGIKIGLELYSDVPQVAVFDTAFHHQMPEHVYRYPIPENWFSQYGIRRYGFHGSSHHYVTKQAAELLGQPLEELNLISLHLGNGASACAIQNGGSIDTSMGFTPLEGLMMGNRSGDLDAAIPLYLQQHFNLRADEVEHALNFDSGLQAICHTHDMHDIIEQAEQGESEAKLALDMFIYHIRKYIGAYLIELDSVDAIIFTGGIGEHAPLIRQRCCANLERFGIELDEQRNNAQRRLLSTVDSETKILLINTNEELQIAEEVKLTLLPSKP